MGDLHLHASNSEQSNARLHQPELHLHLNTRAFYGHIYCRVLVSVDLCEKLVINALVKSVVRKLTWREWAHSKTLYFLLLLLNLYFIPSLVVNVMPSAETSPVSNSADVDAVGVISPSSGWGFTLVAVVLRNASEWMKWEINLEKKTHQFGQARPDCHWETLPALPGRGGKLATPRYQKSYDT